jgi:hypothetical protein
VRDVWIRFRILESLERKGEGAEEAFGVSKRIGTLKCDEIAETADLGRIRVMCFW